MATPLQSFAAGAALCSTSLGTTFTVLDTSGLTTTRLGVILTSAAMMDDVVGLIMVQVISNLGSSESSFSAITVVRPVIVSIALVIILVLSCRFIVKPATIVLNNWCESAAPDSAMRRVFQYKSTALVVHSAILFGLVTGASYAGTSNLYAAYLAGASISWRDTEIPRSSTKVEVTPTPTPSGESSEPSEKFQTHEQPPRNVDSIAELQTIESPQTNQTNKETSRSKATKHEQPRNVENPSPRNPPHWTGSTIYKDYYLAPVQRILKPLFFVSTKPTLHPTNPPPPPTTQPSNLSLGFHRPRHPHHRDVLRPHPLARHRLRRPDDPRKDDLRNLARAVRSPQGPFHHYHHRADGTKTPLPLPLLHSRSRDGVPRGDRLPDLLRRRERRHLLFCILLFHFPIVVGDLPDRHVGDPAVYGDRPVGRGDVGQAGEEVADWARARGREWGWGSVGGLGGDLI